MTESEQRNNQFEARRQKIVQKGFSLYGVGRAVRQGLSRAGLVCEALGCTNPGGAFTSERDDQIVPVPRPTPLTTPGRADGKRGASTKNFCSSHC